MNIYRKKNIGLVLRSKIQIFEFVWHNLDADFNYCVDAIFDALRECRTLDMLVTKLEL